VEQAPENEENKMMSNVIRTELTLGDDVVEWVDRFVFMRSQVDMKAGCMDEIKRRLAMRRAEMIGLGHWTKYGVMVI